jgi:hypothetical protein
MFSRLRKLLPILLAALAVLGLSACGDSHTRVSTGTYAGEAGDAAPYLNVGPLLYEVQVSRQLNPANPEDATYLQGLTPQESKLEPGQEWFAMFIQIYNNHSHAYPAASTYTIYDTQGNTYNPVAIGAGNPFAFRGGLVPAKNQIPLPGTEADDSGPQGALLLYKIQTVSLDNRPLELRIIDPENAAEFATAELDV